MWPALTFVAIAAAAGLHVWWSRRHASVERTLREKQRALTNLTETHEQINLQKQAEQQALFNSMTEGVLVLDAGGRIQLANESLRKLFRLSKEVRGQTIMEAFRLQELAEVIRRLEEDGAVS